MLRPAASSSPRRAVWRGVAAVAALTVALTTTAVPAGGQASGTTGPAGTSVPPGTAPAPTARLGTPVFSARRMPSFVRAPVVDARAADAVAPVLTTLPPASCLAVTHHGRRIVEHDAATALAPASTLKVLTAAAVLDAIPPDTVLTTRLVAAAPPVSGVVEGNVWLIGGGDPLLTTPGYQKAFEDPAQPINDFAKLADAVKAAGITEIRGDIVGDDSRYDTQRSIPSWPERYKRQDTVGPISALMVNDGKTGYTATPDAPSTQRKPGDPPVLAAETLKSLLAQRGITVTGGASSGTAPGGSAEVAHLDALPMRDIVGEMLADSDNTTAEVLLKELGRTKRGAGTTAEGLAAQREILEKLGIPLDGVTIVDGSGLDEGNRLTCRALVTLLDRLGPDSPVSQGFAVAARKGTLRREMRTPQLNGKVLAKTGTLPTVVSLSGYVTTHDGEQLTFAMIQNGTGVDEGKRDALVTALTTYPDGPSVEEIGPLAPRP